MKYYSEILNKCFDSIEDCTKAEKEHADEMKKKDELKLKKKQRADEVTAAWNKLIDVKKEYAKKIADAENEFEELKSKFIKDYGSFHMTFTEKDDGKNPPSSKTKVDVLNDIKSGNEITEFLIDKLGIDKKGVNDQFNAIVDICNFLGI